MSAVAQHPYTPTDEEVAGRYIDARYQYSDTRKAETRAEFDRFLARVRRDAALTLAEHFSAEAIDQARQGNPDGADFYRAVATEIENQIPEGDNQ